MILLVTSTVTVQFPPAGISAPVNSNTLPPATVVTETRRFAHVPPNANGEAKTILFKVSVNAAPVSANVFGLLSVKTIVAVPPGVIGLPVNALVIVGGKSSSTIVTVPLDFVASGVYAADNDSLASTVSGPSTSESSTGTTSTVTLDTPIGNIIVPDKFG